MKIKFENKRNATFKRYKKWFKELKKYVKQVTGLDYTYMTLYGISDNALLIYGKGANHIWISDAVTKERLAIITEE